MNKRQATTITEPAGAESLANSLQAFLEQGAETLSTLKAQVSGVIDATQRGSQLLEQTKQLVDERPLTSVAVAFVLGYVAMRIQTSKLTPLAMTGGLLYLVLRKQQGKAGSSRAVTGVR